MIICVALDDNQGMMFNHRRQSQDRVLRQVLLEETKASRLWMNSYTAGQFEQPLANHIIVDEQFLAKAEEDDYCFVENISIVEYEQRMKKIILFKWNRRYPADRFFDVPLAAGGWRIFSSVSFEGNSHRKITKEIWEVQR